jgi:CBS domain-containing protein
MRTHSIPLSRMTAADLMSTELVVIAQSMPIRDAVRLLFAKQISGAPVVDAAGRCVGVVSRSDFAMLGLQHGADVLVAPARPNTCDFQIHDVGPDGFEKVSCTLPERSCPHQRAARGPDGRIVQTCIQPHCVAVDWQVVQPETLPSSSVGEHMTRDPVTTAHDTPARDVARHMVEGQIHRIIVVDEEARPIGIVSTTDLLAEIAFGEQYSVLSTNY